VEQGHADNEGHDEFEAAKSLPKKLPETLAPNLERALRHWMRRRIVRTLNQDLNPWTPGDLLPTLPGANLSSLNYHALVLEDCGIVTLSHVKPNRGGFVRAYVSNAPDNTEVVSILRATQQQDEEAEDGRPRFGRE
jgi:hypothetical protein